MKTLKQVKQENEAFSGLIQAVINGLGELSSVKDVNEHGAVCGFGKFIYYTDTCAFARKHQRKIIQLLEIDAESFGEEIAEMVSHFGTFRKSPMTNDDRRELYRFLSGSKCKDTTIPNLMCWYAVETVCRWFED